MNAAEGNWTNEGWVKVEASAKFTLHPIDLCFQFQFWLLFVSSNDNSTKKKKKEMEEWKEVRIGGGRERERERERGNEMKEPQASGEMGHETKRFSHYSTSNWPTFTRSLNPLHVRTIFVHHSAILLWFKVKPLDPSPRRNEWNNKKRSSGFRQKSSCFTSPPNVISGHTFLKIGQSVAIFGAMEQTLCIFHWVLLIVFLFFRLRVSPSFYLTFLSNLLS